MHARVKREKEEALNEHKAKLLQPVNTLDPPEHHRVHVPRQPLQEGIAQHDESAMPTRKHEEGGYITLSEFTQVKNRYVEEHRRLQKAAQHTVTTLKKILRQKSATVKRLCY